MAIEPDGDVAVGGGDEAALAKPPARGANVTAMFGFGLLRARRDGARMQGCLREVPTRYSLRGYKGREKFSRLAIGTGPLRPKFNNPQPLFARTRFPALPSHAMHRIRVM